MKSGAFLCCLPLLAVSQIWLWSALFKYVIIILVSSAHSSQVWFCQPPVFHLPCWLASRKQRRANRRRSWLAYRKKRGRGYCGLSMSPFDRFRHVAALFLTQYERRWQEHNTSRKSQRERERERRIFFDLTNCVGLVCAVVVCRCSFNFCHTGAKGERIFNISVL